MFNLYALDVVFVSRLLRIVIEGVKTDTPKALDNFYGKYENHPVLR
jgi:hypothetical protein